MRRISLSTIVLFALVFIRLSMVQYTNSWGLFFTYFITFLILLGILLIDVLSYHNKKILDYLRLSKPLLIGFLIIIVIFIPLCSLIYQRAEGDKYALVHDGIIQTEEAIKYLLAGKNFYTEDYTNTPVADWSGGILQEFLSGESFINPAIYHNIYLPFYILVSTPFYWLSDLIFNWYDQRVVLIMALIVSIILLIKLGGIKEKTLLVTILLFFNPLFVRFFIEGRNDIFIIFLIILTVYLLAKEKYRISSIPFALACLSKHSAWLLLPFYFLYLYYKATPSSARILKRIKELIRIIYPLIIIGIIILVPFLVWDFPSFWEDIFLYPSGKIATSYPITGYGFSQFFLLTKTGVETIFDYFPFWIIQLIVGIPLFYLLFRIQKRNNTITQLLINYGIFLLVFWIFSRFFNDNYITYLVIIFILAYFMEDKEKHKTSEGIIT